MGSVDPGRRHTRTWCPPLNRRAKTFPSIKPSTVRAHASAWRCSRRGEIHSAMAILEVAIRFFMELISSYLFGLWGLKDSLPFYGWPFCTCQHSRGHGTSTLIQSHRDLPEPASVHLLGSLSGIIFFSSLRRRHSGETKKGAHRTEPVSSICRRGAPSPPARKGLIKGISTGWDPSIDTCQL